jgi:hypothetical protein
MVQRYNNPKNPWYKNYGARGIKIYNRWLKFENFLEDMGERPEGKSIDRINNNLDYCKENCKWSTRKEQQRNIRNNHVVEYDNKKQCASELAQEYNIDPNVFIGRLRLGWSIKKALKTPVKKYKKKI